MSADLQIPINATITLMDDEGNPINLDEYQDGVDGVLELLDQGKIENVSQLAGNLLVRVSFERALFG